MADGRGDVMRVALVLILGLGALAGCTAQVPDAPQYDCVTTSYDLTECSLRDDG